MAINIEKMRADMRWEARKFFISTVLAAAALVGAGAALGNYLAHHEPPPPPPPPAPLQNFFQLPPGTIITTPGGPAQK